MDLRHSWTPRGTLNECPLPGDSQGNLRFSAITVLLPTNRRKILKVTISADDIGSVGKSWVCLSRSDVHYLRALALLALISTVNDRSMAVSADERYERWFMNR